MEGFHDSETWRGQHAGRLECATSQDAILGWLFLIGTLTAIGASVGQQPMTMGEYAARGSAKGLRILDAVGITMPAGELGLVHSDALTAESTDLQATVRDVGARVEATGVITELRDPYTVAIAEQVCRPVDAPRQRRVLGAHAEPIHCWPGAVNDPGPTTATPNNASGPTLPAQANPDVPARRRTVAATGRLRLVRARQG